MTPTALKRMATALGASVVAGGGAVTYYATQPADPPRITRMVLTNLSDCIDCMTGPGVPAHEGCSQYQFVCDCTIDLLDWQGMELWLAETQ